MRDRRGARRRAPPGGRADRRRRVDPPRRRPLPRARPRGRRHRRAQGAAARRGARLPADRRGHRAARRRVLRAGDQRRHRRRRRAGRRAARAALRVRAGHRAAAHRRPGGRAAAARRRRAAGDDGRRSTRPRSTGCAAAPDRVAALGGAAGRGPRAAAGSATREHLHRAGPRVVGAPRRGRRHARSCSRPGSRNAPLGLRRPRRRRGRPAAAPHPDRRAHRRLPRPGADPHRRAGRRRLHVRHRRRQPAPRGARGRPRRACRWWSSPPTARRGCAAPVPTRPPTRSAIFGPLVDDPRPRPTAPTRLRPGAGPLHLNVQLDEPLVPDDRWVPDVDAGASGRSEVRPAVHETVALGPAHRRGGRRRRRAARADAGRAGAAGRCSPSRPAARAPAPTRSAATGCCSTATSARRIERVVVFGHPTLSPAGQPAAGPRRRRRCSTPAAAGVWSERPFPVADRFSSGSAGGATSPTTPPGWRSGAPPTGRSRRQLDAAAGRRARPHAVRGGGRGQPRAAARRACWSSAPPARSATST